MVTPRELNMVYRHDRESNEINGEKKLFGVLPLRKKLFAFDKV